MHREGFCVVEISRALGVVTGTVYKWLRNAKKNFREAGNYQRTAKTPQGCWSKTAPPRPGSGDPLSDYR